MITVCYGGAVCRSDRTIEHTAERAAGRIEVSEVKYVESGKARLNRQVLLDLFGPAKFEVHHLQPVQSSLAIGSECELLLHSTQGLELGHCEQAALNESLPRGGGLAGLSAVVVI